MSISGAAQRAPRADGPSAPRSRGSAFEAASRFWRLIKRERIAGLASLSVGLLLAGAAGVYLFERISEEANIATYGEALWFGIVTMTGTGYGDFTPKTPAGRVVGVLLMLGGMTVLTLFSATLASILVTNRIREGRGLETVNLRNHILICGWNQYAERVLEGLLAIPANRGRLVLINELPEETAADILSRYPAAGLRYVRGDPAHEAALERASVRQAGSAIVLADTSRGFAAASDERTMLVTLALKSLKPDINVTVEALDLASEAHLRRAGADEIVISGEFNGYLLSRSATSPGIALVVRELLSFGGNELCRQPIPADFIGKTFHELFDGLRTRSGFLTLAIVTEERGLTLDDLLTDDYSLVDEFIKQQFTEAGTEYLRFETGGTQVCVNPPDSYVIGRGDTAIGIPRGT